MHRQTDRQIYRPLQEYVAEIMNVMCRQTDEMYLVPT